MSAVTVAQTFAATVPDAERLWSETARWPRWVDGLERVLEVSGGWPQVGSAVRWVSGPAGRGEVTERVTAREPLSTLVTAVSDASLKGEQTVSFMPGAGGVHVTLRLDYRLRSRSPLMRVVDLLFIRRAMRSSLELTLARFGADLQASAPPPP
ncbi:MAG TPA: SRPBCC family protein [Solirubrobacteraceae bacterium]|nr:SRPBCC family protein [Solirubrobacteraceae bacterium]